MSEDLYAKVDLTKKVRFQTAEEDTNADNNSNIDNVTIYDNSWAEGSTPPKSQDNTADDQRQTTLVNVSSGQRNLFKDAAAVFLGLLCLVLLAAVIVLVVLWIQDKNNWRGSNDKLISEKDELQTSYSEKESLNHNLTLKTSELQVMINNLTNETDKLQTSFRESKSLNHNLTLKISKLEIMINNHTNETEKLKTRYHESKSLNEDLKLNISKLEAKNNNLISERNELKRAIGLVKSGWVYFSGSLYYMSSLEKSWQQSRDDCQQRGADLVIINSKEEQEFVIHFQKRMWIGLTDKETAMTWKWVDGTRLNTSFWNTKEPNNAGTAEDCVVIWAFDSEKSWNDDPCDRKKYWICEKRLP